VQGKCDSGEDTEDVTMVKETHQRERAGKRVAGSTERKLSKEKKEKKETHLAKRIRAVAGRTL